MFRFSVNTHFCFCIITRSKNPYLSLPSDQLRSIIKQKLADNTKSINQVNALIQLGVASQNKKMISELHLILQSCMKNLEGIQKIVNQHQQHELASFEMGQLLSILYQYPSYLAEKQAQKLTQLYLNTYSHLLSFSKQFAIYQHSRNHDSLDLIAQISHQKVIKIVKQEMISLADYVAYLRLFYHQINPEQLNQKLKQYSKRPKLCKLTQNQLLTLFFIVMSTKADVKLIENLGLEPNLNISSEQESKYVCMKLQILQYKNQPIPDLNIIDLANWDYNNLVWISQFCSGQQQFKQKLHKYILLSTLSQGTKPSTIFTYALNAQISGQKHHQLSNWLCEGNGVNVANQQDLCRMLSQISSRKWESYYQTFYRAVLKLSLGNFKWESQNIIYYYGSIQHIEDENMDYLRKYILNTYASLGTARKQIPTSSYFYKILGIVEVQKFYKNYFDY